APGWREARPAQGRAGRCPARRGGEAAGCALSAGRKICQFQDPGGGKYRRSPGPNRGRGGTGPLVRRGRLRPRAGGPGWCEHAGRAPVSELLTRCLRRLRKVDRKAHIHGQTILSRFAFRRIERMKILGICSSPRGSRSNTLRLVGAALEGAEEKGAEV